MLLDGNACVRDIHPTRRWQNCTAGITGTACEAGSLLRLGFAEAIDHCESLAFGGYDDWRLPDLLEVYSIMTFGTDAGVEVQDGTRLYSVLINGQDGTAQVVDGELEEDPETEWEAGDLEQRIG